MNTPFLTQVARHYASVPGTICFVFPNRRSLVHFRREAVAAGIDGRGHRAFTMDGLMKRISGISASDRIALLLELYGAYVEINPDAEPLDGFLGWGGTVLGDFDDIDRHGVDPQAIFSGDSLARPLTSSQREALSHVSALLEGEDADAVRERFRRDWRLLGSLYGVFSRRLAEKGLAYGGMAYRKAAEKILEEGGAAGVITRLGGVGKVVFVGLNALGACERTVLGGLKAAGFAEFVWDYCTPELNDPDGMAAAFAAGNMRDFPQAFALEGITSRPDVKVIAVPSAVAMAKLAPEFLRGCRVGTPEETAFVLADESLLMPLLSAVPEDAGRMNVTMGYPLAGSAAASFVKSLGELQLSATEGGFYHRCVMDVASHPLVRAVLSEEEAATITRIRNEARVRVHYGDFVDGELFTVLFRPVVTDRDASDAARNGILGGYIEECLMAVGKMLAAKDGADAAGLDLLRRCTEAVAAFTAAALPVRPATWLSALGKALRSETVPFDGEPLEGIQVMGFLETRSLDFRNVAVIGANEDRLPRRGGDTSAIPPEVRRAFGLPTAEYRDAVQAYHFYRLMQRAENVWLVYDSRTEGMHTGEESRYVRQMEYLYGYPVARAYAEVPMEAVATGEAIPKTEADVEAIRAGHLSASSLQDYLYCPAKFYYHVVKGLSRDRDVTDKVDAATFGTVFHGVMEELYKDRTTVTVEAIRAMLDDEDGLRERVARRLLDELHMDVLEGRNAIVAGVILAYVKAALGHDQKLPGMNGQFRMLGLERRMEAVIDGFRFVGFIDRIDTYRRGEVRIVDYKTGRVEDNDILITDANAEAVCAKLFGESNSSRPKIALQLYLYGVFARQGLLRPGETLVNSIYSTARLVTDPLPDVPESPRFRELVEEKLRGVLGEIADTSVPFRRTCDRATCAMCDFRAICGR